MAQGPSLWSIGIDVQLEGSSPHNSLLNVLDFPLLVFMLYYIYIYHFFILTLKLSDLKIFETQYFIKLAIFIVTLTCPNV